MSVYYVLGGEGVWLFVCWFVYVGCVVGRVGVREREKKSLKFNLILCI